MECKLWLMKHRGLSYDGFSSEQQIWVSPTWKRSKNLSCWKCMMHFTSMHFNASVRANFYQLSKHLPNQIIACKICGFQRFAIVEQHLVINLITAAICQPMYFVCKRCTCPRQPSSAVVAYSGLVNVETSIPSIWNERGHLSDWVCWLKCYCHGFSLNRIRCSVLGRSLISRTMCWFEMGHIPQIVHCLPFVMDQMVVSAAQIHMLKS